jgi:hypothetical protein
LQHKLLVFFIFFLRDKLQQSLLKVKFDFTIARQVAEKIAPCIRTFKDSSKKRETITFLLIYYAIKR